MTAPHGCIAKIMIFELDFLGAEARLALHVFGQRCFYSHIRALHDSTYIFKNAVLIPSHPGECREKK